MNRPGPSGAEPPPAIMNVLDPQPAADAASYAYTAVGLPRRVPRSHAVPSLVPPRPAALPPTAPIAVPPSAAATGAMAAQRNPNRTRGFLNDYQAGVRQGAHSRPDTSTELSTDFTEDR